MSDFNYYQYFLDTKGNRDYYFNYVLNLFKNRPINILELGCARNLALECRGSDGWSSLHFYNYIKNNGGRLDIVDNNQDSLENCKILLNSDKDFGIVKNISIINSDAFKVLSDATIKYDLVFLDIADDPNLSLECFERINLDNSLCFIDDFHTKGSLIESKYKNFINLTWSGNEHRMALYGKDTKADKIII